MGIFNRRSGVDRRLRLVRSMGGADRREAGSQAPLARERMKRAALRVLLVWALISCGFVWCVAGRECDYEWACFSATFYPVIVQ